MFILRYNSTGKMIVLYFLSTVFTTAILFLVGCLGPRDPPPLYTVRMERHKKRFEKDDRIKKYTDQMKKERQVEEEEAAKIQLMRPVTNAVENKGQKTQKDSSSNHEKSTSRTNSSVVSGKQNEEEDSNTVRCNMGPSLQPLKAAPSIRPSKVAPSIRPSKAAPSLRPSKVAPTKGLVKKVGPSRDVVTAAPKSPVSSTRTAMAAPTKDKTVALNLQTAVRQVSVRRAQSMRKGQAEGKKAEPNLKTALIADKTNLPFVTAGGEQKVKLTNKGKIPLIIKTRCSDNQILGVVPVFSHVDVGKSVDVMVTRLGAPAKKDKVVFEWLPDPSGEKDFAGYFRKFEIIENKIELQLVIT